jgi:hypothetical protein
MLKRLLNIYAIQAPVNFSTPRKILDSATADGLWLRDLASSLSLSTQGSHYFVGTDINPDALPQNSPENFKYALQDVNKSWPQDWNSSFDLVHQRLVLGASGPKTQDVAKNLAGLVKPGGWIQLEEPSAKDDESAPKTWRLGLRLASDMIKMMGSKWGIGDDLAEYLRAAGFERVEEKVFEVKYGAKNPDVELAKKGVEVVRLSWKTMIGTAKSRYS